MRSFSVESKPLLKNNNICVVWLSYALILLGVANSVLILSFLASREHFAKTGFYGWRLAVIMSFYIGLPVLHHFKFSSDYAAIPIIFEFSNFPILAFILTVCFTLIGSCTDGECVAESVLGTMLMLTFNMVMSSTCAHFYNRLDRVSRVEEEVLLGYDRRREKVHFALLDNIEELIGIKEKFETFITTEVFLCASASIMYYHIKGELGIVTTVVNIIVNILLTYRNFVFGCSWNAKLEQFEAGYQLKFDKLKVKCYGVVVSDRFVILVFGSFLSFALRDLILGQ